MSQLKLRQRCRNGGRRILPSSDDSPAMHDHDQVGRRKRRLIVGVRHQQEPLWHSKEIVQEPSGHMWIEPRGQLIKDKVIIVAQLEPS